MKENSSNGIYAGLPWFFQFWARDEAISLKAVSLIGKNLTAKKTILRLMNTIQSDGNIPNRIPPTDLGCADAVGWTFKRASQLMTNFLPLEKKLIKRKLYQSINSLLKNHTEDNLAMNGPQETWMDTVYQDDYRNGARIEIQAMRLQMYQLMYKLSNQKIYRDLELRLKKRVRDLFWNDKYLADGLGDWTIRPNLFIAYYVYPQLLSKEEWKTCFKFVLKHLWLDWGGLSTIEKHHPLFHENYSGEVPESYHRGDSWFWINNLAAICLYKVDKKYFKNYIGKIIKASLKEMLELGTIGCSAELSSSNELKSQGCLSQAWSSAMFIELLKILD